MTRNTLSDLNNHLFEQLERLNDEDLTSEELNREISRSKAVSSIAKSIVENGALALEAKKFTDNRMDAETVLPRMLDSDKI